MAEGEECVLESFRRFEVRLHFENGFFLNLSHLYTHVSRKVISVSEVSAVKFLHVFNSFFIFVYIEPCNVPYS